MVEQIKQSKFNIIPWVWMIIGVIINTWYQLVPGEWVVDSDLAAEMVLANLYNSEGVILSKNWIYSTELRVVNLQFLYRLGLRMFPNNWTYARTVAMLIFMLMIIATWLFVGYVCNAGVFGVWMAAFAMWPFGFLYHYLCTYGAYYWFYNISALLVMGCIGYAIRNGILRKNAIIALLITCVISLISGLNGVRMTMTFHLPLVVATFCMLILEITKKNINSVGDIYRKCKKVFVLFLYSMISLITNALGYLVNMFVLSDRYIFANYGDISWINTETRIIDKLADFVRLFGYRGDTVLFSFDGVASTIGFCIGGLIVLSSIRLFFHYDELQIFEQMVVMLFIFSFIINGVALVYLGHSYAVNYWLPLVPYGIFILFTEIKNETFYLNNTRNMLLLCIVTGITICSISTIKLAIQKPVHGNRDLFEAAIWLKDNGYNQGFAQYWNATCLTEMTDGYIDVWAMQGSSLTYGDQLVSHMHVPDGRVFYLVKGDVDSTSQYKTIGKGGKLVHKNDSFCIYEYEDATFWDGEVNTDVSR